MTLSASCVVTPAGNVRVPLVSMYMEVAAAQDWKVPRAVPSEVAYLTVTVPCPGALRVTGSVTEPSASPTTTSGGAEIPGVATGVTDGDTG